MKIDRKFGTIFFLYFCFVLVSKAQEPIVKDKVFNFGVKVGLNSSFPIVNSLTVDGAAIDDISYKYRVGYLAAIFCRINVERFFIQPSISWAHFKEDIQVHNLDGLSYTVNSVKSPVLIGYKILKEGPYDLSIMVGPTIKYNYDVQYTSDDTPWAIDGVCGVGVSIRRLLFDITYEFGLNQVGINDNNISIDKRANMLGFSLGLLF